MNPEEIRLRSLYLFVTCSRTVSAAKERLLATFSSPPLSSTVMLERSLTRELGILFRYWTTRQIWDHLEDTEEDAKLLNLALLRLFTEGLKLPKDGSGLRYAELSNPSEEVRELGQRITAALGMEHQPLLDALQAGILSWRDDINQRTKDALELSLSQISTAMKEWSVESSKDASG